MNNNIHIIWQDAIYENEADWESAYEEWKSDADNPYADMTIDEFISVEVGAYFDDEIANLSVITTTNGVIAVASVGRWNGTTTGYREFKNVADCFYCGGNGYKKFYVEDGDFQMEESHHDGMNCVVFREWNDGVTEDEKERLREALACGEEEVAEDLVSRYTRPLGGKIAEVYGWQE